MTDKKRELTIGALLHDIGKIVYRAEQLRGKLSHSVAGYQWFNNYISDNVDQHQIIRDSIRYHHLSKMKDFGNGHSDDDLIFIVSLADHISAKADRRLNHNPENEIEMDDQTQTPLNSIFNKMDLDEKRQNVSSYDGRNIFSHKNEIIYPIDKASIKENTYKESLHLLKNSIKDYLDDDKYLNSMINAIGILFKYLPSDTRKNQHHDISLAAHSITTALFASCLYDYFCEKGITNYKEIWKKESMFFKNEKAFCMFSFDFSGIQKFIYDIGNTDALKNLRSRSLYLELLGEYFADTIVSSLKLSRANVVYVGGGHGYILLPNTGFAKKEVMRQTSIFNNFLLDNFNYDLFLATSMMEATVVDLTDNFSNTIKTLFEHNGLSKRKKFSFSDLYKLNERSFDGRECGLCGKSHDLKDNEFDSEKSLCEICSSFSKISSLIVNEDRKFYVVRKKKNKNIGCYIVPGQYGNNYIHICTKDEFEKTLKTEEDILFSYAKGEYVINAFGTKTLYIADYAVNDGNRQFSIEEIVNKDYDESGSGIKRIAVMKADVDNLGIKFRDGFDDEMYTISRMAVLSDSISMYFKYYINILLRSKQYNCTIIYSGGDDIFIMGTLKDIISFSKEFYYSFQKYTLGKLHFSAGIGLFNIKYPIYKIAKEVDTLEMCAKSSKNKNSVCLFQTGNDLKWEELFGIIENEYEIINDCIQNEIITDTMLYGSIYKILLSKDTSKIKYRLAYLFGRTKDKIKNKNHDINKMHGKLFDVLMKAANENQHYEKKKVLIAIQIYIYSNRRRENK